MTDAFATHRPDTRDMVAVHDVFRNAFSQAPALISGASTDGRVATISSFYANLLAFLHTHHEAEDELLWPKLLERSETASDLITSMSAEHTQIAQVLGDAQTELGAWTEAPNQDTATALTATLTALDSKLRSHLDHEEREILTLAADHLSVEEWGELPGHAMRTFTGDKLWLVIGLVADAMTPAQRQLMLDQMPPPLQTFWTSTGRAQYETFLAEVHG